MILNKNKMSFVSKYQQKLNIFLQVYFVSTMSKHLSFINSIINVYHSSIVVHFLAKNFKKIKCISKNFSANFGRKIEERF
jgi:hypothetical protein